MQESEQGRCENSQPSEAGTHMFPELFRNLGRQLPQFAPGWLHEQVVLGGVLCLVIGYVLVRSTLRRQRDRPTLAFAIPTRTASLDGSEPGYSRSIEWVVVCQNCGTRNSLEYRFCYRCVSPLPEQVVHVRHREMDANR